MGCSLNAAGCEAGRVHDWNRAKSEVLALYVGGQITLCKDHQKQLSEVCGIEQLPPVSLVEPKMGEEVES